MPWKSASITEINEIKIKKRIVFLCGIILFIMPYLVGITLNLSPKVFSSMAILFVFVGVGCLVFATNILKLRFYEATNDYVSFSVTLPWSSSTYRFYFDEIDSISVGYTWYTVDFDFIMKYGVIKLNLWGFGPLYNWLFPLLDKLYGRCNLSIANNPKFLQIKEWSPRRQTIKETWYDKVSKKIWVIIIILVMIWLFINWWFIYRRGW